MPQQTVVIGVGENPPIVTVTALALVDAFRKANEDQGSKPFMTFLVMAGHFANSNRFPLLRSFAEAGLVGPSEELARFFEDNALTENARKALELLTDEENAEQSDLAAFLAIAKKQFG